MTGIFVRGNNMAFPWLVDESRLMREESAKRYILGNFAISRRPFYTKPNLPASSQGLLSYAPDTAQVGDELWVLKGDKVPYILRPKAMPVPSVDLAMSEANDLSVDIGVPTYELVSKAFILGLMDGEIIDMIRENPKRERPPLLADMDMDRDFRAIGLI